VKRGTFRDESLGIRRGLGYRSWTIDSSPPTAENA
jgi:hypothetical protein